jgi:hypothetical protein
MTLGVTYNSIFCARKYETPRIPCLSIEHRNMNGKRLFSRRFATSWSGFVQRWLVSLSRGADK